jgi:DNA-directed RNA polymerase subunit RPC12/RpoP
VESVMRFKDKIIRFFVGRYGNDQLNNFALALIVAIFIVDIFIDSIVLSVIYLILWCLMIFRMMSRNIYKRRAENEKFMKLWNPVKNKFKLAKNKYRDRKTHVYKKCPKCKAILRLPKQKGSHTVRCPKCSERFDIKI